MDKQKRLEAVNEFIKVIASCGREFFKHDGFVSYMELSESGRVFFIDYYTKKRIYTHKSGIWKGFTSGGTLKSFVEALRDYVMWGGLLRSAYFDNDPEDIFRNTWGYEDDILKVKDAAIKLGIAKQPERSNR